MLENMDYFIYDLHSGKLEDLEWAVKAMTKAPLEREKNLIVISSVLSWGGNPHYIVEDKPEEENIEENNELDKKDKSNYVESNLLDQSINNKDQGHLSDVEEQEDNENFIDDIEEKDFKNDKVVDNFSNNENDPNITNDLEYNEDNPKKKKDKLKKIKIVKEIKYKRIGYSEEEYEKRIPIESYKKIKEYEDYLLNLQVENLNIYIICAGIPYGNCETVFNYFFKTAWLQNPNYLPYFGAGDNLIPTIHVKDLAKIVKKIVSGNKPEGKYIFAVDENQDKSMKSIISAISKGIGSGKTKSIEKTDDWIRSLNFKTQDFYIDPKLNDKNNLTLIITDNELKWQGYLGVDIMLKRSKFIDEDFEWHCKEGISLENIPKLLNEFCLNRRLSPIKIILNCSDKNIRCVYAKKLSKFFNIPILNYEKSYDMINLNEEKLSEEEKLMMSKYLFLKERMQFIEQNPDFLNEENLLLYDSNEITIEAMKYMLKENACVNRGYVLEGMPINLEEIERLYYKKVEKTPEDGEAHPDEDEDDELIEEKHNEEDHIEEQNIQPDSMTISMNDENKDIKSQNNDEEEHAEESNEEKSSNRKTIAYGNEGNNGEDNENKSNEDKPKEKKKKKKIRPKVYKTVFEKDLLPHSVITLCIKNKDNPKVVNNHFWPVENFFQKNKIEVLNLILDNDQEEVFEMMRIYIERVNI